MKALDLYCGLGGWSDGFVKEGFEVLGVEIDEKIAKRYQHPCLVADIRELHGKMFQTFDVVIGSPPCVEFSNARYKSRHVHGKNPNPEKGMELINEFWRIVDEANPRFYAMENLKVLTKYHYLFKTLEKMKRKPQWHFMISKGGKRCLWTNIPLPLTTEYRFHHKIRDIHGWEKTRPLRSKIPMPIARMIAKAVKANLKG